MVKNEKKTIKQRNYTLTKNRLKRYAMFRYRILSVEGTQRNKQRDDSRLTGTIDFHYKWTWRSTANVSILFIIFPRPHPIWIKFYYLTKTDPNLTAQSVSPLIYSLAISSLLQWSFVMVNCCLYSWAPDTNTALCCVLGTKSTDIEMEIIPIYGQEGGLTKTRQADGPNDGSDWMAHDGPSATRMPGRMAHWTRRRAARNKWRFLQFFCFTDTWAPGHFGTKTFRHQCRQTLRHWSRSVWTLWHCTGAEMSVDTSAPYALAPRHFGTGKCWI